VKKSIILVLVLLVGAITFSVGAWEDPPFQGIWFSTDPWGTTQYGGPFDFDIFTGTLYVFVGDSALDNPAIVGETVQVSFTSGGPLALDAENNYTLLEIEWGVTEVKGLFRGIVFSDGAAAGANTDLDLSDARAADPDGETLFFLLSNGVTAFRLDVWPGCTITAVYGAHTDTLATPKKIYIGAFGAELPFIDPGDNFPIEVRDWSANTDNGNQETVNVDLDSTGAGSTNDTIVVEESANNTGLFNQPVAAANFTTDFSSGVAQDVTLYLTNILDVVEASYDDPITKQVTVGQPVTVWDDLVAAGIDHTNADNEFRDSYADVNAAVAGGTTVAGDYLQVHKSYTTEAGWPIDLTKGTLVLESFDHNDKATIDGLANLPYIKSTGAGVGVTIQYLNLKHSTAAGGFGITPLVNNMTIDHCAITGSASQPISLANGTANHVITNNTFVDAAVFNGTLGPTHIYCSGNNVTNVTIENNEFNTNGQAIGLESGMNTLVVRYNKFEGRSAIGIQVTPFTITNATVQYNSFLGMAFTGSSGGNTNTYDMAGFDCTYNDWNDTTGPWVSNEYLGDGNTVYDAGENLDGAGAVCCYPHNFNYRPWLNGAPVCGVDAVGANNALATFQGNKTVNGSSWYWSIQDAINGAAAGDTITVSTGTYAEVATANRAINVTKNLTIQEAAGNTAIIETDVAAGNIVYVNDDVNLTFDGIDTQWNQGVVGTFAAVSHHGDTLTLKNSSIPGGAIGVLIFDDDAAPRTATGTIESCVITAPTGKGIDLERAAAGWQIKSNTIFGADTNGTPQTDIGVHVQEGDATLTANTISYCGIGVQLDTAGNTLTSASSGNMIRDNTTHGIKIGAAGQTITYNDILSNADAGVFIDNTAFGVGTTINFNRILGNTNNGVDNDNAGVGPTAPSVDARNNYWGHASGPFHAALNPTGQGDNVTDYVNFKPFWTVTTGPTSASYTYDDGAGFYGMSVPLVPGDPTPAAVYDEIGPTVTVYGAYPYVVGYTADPDIDPEKGTWLYMLGNTTIGVEGTEVAGPTVQVDLGAAGWYMISAPWTTDWDVAVCTGTFHNDGAGRIALWASNYPTPGGYVLKYSDSQFILDPWQSYWVLSTSVGATITFTKTTLPATPPLSALSPMGLHAPTVSPPPPPALRSGDISVALSKSADGVHFVAAGPALSLRAKVLSVDGTLIAEKTAAGDELVWSMQTSAGELVANGVYLIQISAETYTGWVDLGLFRVLVLR